MNHCKICFKEIKIQGFNALKPSTICQRCYNEFNVIFLKTNIENVKVISLYDYNATLKKLLFQYKGCFDIELKSVFLERHLNELRIKYREYVIVPIPSTKNSDEERGFNHVEEIFAYLQIPIYNCLKKRIDFKQSDLSKEEREKVLAKFIIEKGELLRNKKVLIVDDIITTGSSIPMWMDRQNRRR